MVPQPFPIDWCRRQFPALSRQVDGIPAAFFDGPGGSQLPERVIHAVAHYLAHTNANTGGRYATSRESDEMLAASHAAVADFLGSSSPESVVFGANMTTLTFAFSRALAKTWRPGDEVLVTRLDHDGNVTPWVLAARDAGATVQYVGINPTDCTLDLNDLRAKLSSRTRLVAVGCASNIVGTINPVREIADMAHAAGAQIFLDAVHYAPHALPDVAAWDCDYAACSAYKFFGPHVGVLWGRPELLKSLTPYKLRPTTETLPGRWMTGTQNHEGIAGTRTAIDYLADLGQQVDPSVAHRDRRTIFQIVSKTPDDLKNRPTASQDDSKSRRTALQSSYTAIGEYERHLTATLLAGLSELRSIRVLGIADPHRLRERAPTVSFVPTRHTAAEIAEGLGARGLFIGHGNFYALQLTETLGLEPDGVVRIGLMHYTTAAEIARLLSALRECE